MHTGRSYSGPAFQTNLTTSYRLSCHCFKIIALPCWISSRVGGGGNRSNVEGIQLVRTQVSIILIFIIYLMKMKT